MRDMPDNSVDAIVTDPPYGLKFMGKTWDCEVPSVEIWQECLRVLKPGGHLLAFAGMRTQHRMACRIEDAGFEIRDMIAWVYGSGFPKSANIGKAIDKMQGNEREDVPTNTKMQKQKAVFFKGLDGGKYDPATGNLIGTKGHSDFEGFGSCLKPSLEPITVARKPISEKTIAENCLKWRTGALNIEECRVGTEGAQTKTGTIGSKSVNSFGANFNDTGIQQKLPKGRFPANLIHDGSEEVLELFPNSKSSKQTAPIGTGGIWSGVSNTPCGQQHGDSGSNARFFYCAKSSKSERNKGCDDKGNFHSTVKPVKLMEYLVKLVTVDENSIVLDPFAGSGSTGVACQNLKRKFILIERDPDYCTIIRKRLALEETPTPEEVKLFEDITIEDF